MDKRKALRILSDLTPKIEMIESEKLPVLENKLKEQYFFQKEIEYSDWLHHLPAGFLDRLDSRSSSSSFGISVKDSFHPSELFDNVEWINILYTLEQSQRSLYAYKHSLFSQAKNLQEDLKYIVDNEKNRLLKFFQNKAIKDKIELAKQGIQLNYEILEDLDTRIQKWNYLLSPTEEESLSLKERKLDYLDKISRITKIDDIVAEEYIFQVCLETLESIREFIKQNSKEKIVNDIQKVWEKIKEVQVNAITTNYSVELLEYANDKVEQFVPKLSKTFDRLSDILVSSDDFLQTTCNFSVDDVQLIKKTISQIIDQGKDNFYPKIRADNLSSLEFELLGLLKFYKEYSKDREKREVSFLRDIESWKIKLDKLKKLAPNRFMVNFLSEYKRKEWYEEEIFLYVTCNSFLKSDLLNDIFQLPAYSNSELKTEFIENSATFYALIEEITGSRKIYTPNDLPSWIVDKVKQVKVNKDGLDVTMRSYQEFAVQYILFYENVLLGDEMGLGKTIQAISAANHLFQNGQKQIIVLCPLSVLENWNREVKKWSQIPTFIYRGQRRQEVFEKWQKEGGVLLTNFEQAKILSETLGDVIFDFLVVDEAHYIKNPETKRTIYATKLSKLAQYKLFMTGTPLENRLVEMKHLVKLVNLKLGKKLESKYWSVADFKTQLSSVYLRRKREEVLDELPELEVIELWSQFSPEQQTYYDEAVKDGISGMMRMRRAAFWGRDSKKILQIIDICKEAKENGQKVLVFSFFKEGVLYRLQEELPNVAPLMISGSISPNQRQEILDEFSKSPNQTVLLSQIDAGGVGLNIQAANIVILCEPQWKPSTEQQAISRVYRMGQLRDVIVYRLLTEESVDESMMELLSKKTNLFNRFANDSSIAEAFEQREHFEEGTISESNLRQKVFEIERKRLEIKNSSQMPAVDSFKSRVSN